MILYIVHYILHLDDVLLMLGNIPYIEHRLGIDPLKETSKGVWCTAIPSGRMTMRTFGTIHSKSTQIGT